MYKEMWGQMVIVRFRESCDLLDRTSIEKKKETLHLDTHCGP